MNKQEIKKIAEDVVKIICESKATFFTTDVNIKIPPEEVTEELQAEICTNVEMYFSKLLDEL